jgi:hypothetical protein
MIFLKSILAGLLSLVVAGILALSYVIFKLARLPRAEGEAVGLDPVSMAKSWAKSPLAWIIGVAAFALGSYWEYRRVIK